MLEIKTKQIKIALYLYLIHNIFQLWNVINLPKQNGNSMPYIIWAIVGQYLGYNHSWNWYECHKFGKYLELFGFWFFYWGHLYYHILTNRKTPDTGIYFLDCPIRVPSSLAHLKCFIVIWSHHITMTSSQ